jgi:hypothetical protein
MQLSLGSLEVDMSHLDSRPSSPPNETTSLWPASSTVLVVVTFYEQFHCALIQRFSCQYELINERGVYNLGRKFS